MIKKIDTIKLKEILKKIISQFDKNAILFSILLLCVLLFGLPKFVFSDTSKVINNTNKLFQKKEITENMQKKFLLKQEQTSVKQFDFPIKIYETPYKGIELENAAADLVNRVIFIIRNNGENRILSIDFKKNPLVDNEGIDSKIYSALSLKIEIESTYESIQYILNEIYLMDYLIKIKKISLTPTEESGNEAVEADIILDLFIKIS